MSKQQVNEHTPIVQAVPAYTESVVVDEDARAPIAQEVTPLISQEDEYTEGPKCQDLPFAILFLIQLSIMLWLGVWVAPSGFDTIQLNVTMIEEKIRKSDDVTSEDFQQMEAFATEAMGYLEVYPQRIILYLVFPCCLLGVIYGYLSTALVIRPCPKAIVYACLIGSVIWTAIIMIAGSVASGSVPMYALTGLSLAAVGYFVVKALKMVPFAAVNLKVSLEGISRNSGLYLMAIMLTLLASGWLIFFFYTVIGVSAYEFDECKKKHPELDFSIDSDDFPSDVCGMPPVVTLAFLLSLYWTSTVIQNTLQVTVAGVMATWCFDKADADTCCSPAVFGSLYRSLTYSFGSICLGSLLQALVSVFRYVVEQARNQRERDGNGDGCGALLLCILECLAKLLEDILDYFNQWAYVFVGIYGYSYIESGKRVFELFRARGWTSIITDSLVGYVLAFTSFSVAVVLGASGVVVESILSHQMDDESFIFGPIPQPKVWAFGIGFIVGFWICSVMMNVVKGAVNTLIVCWADSPAALEAQHPKLTKEMKEAWTDIMTETTPARAPAYNAVVV